MKKFQVLIMDDESPYKESQGYYRVLDFFQRLRFVPRTTRFQVKPGSALLVGESPIDFILWGGGTDSSFDTIIAAIQQNEEPILKSADLIFIDIKWEKTGINENSNRLTTEDWNTYARQGNYDRVPKDIAGLEIVKQLKLTKQPKFLFSGARETVSIRYLIMNFFSERLKTNDLLIGDLEEGRVYFPEVEEKINGYFNKIQGYVTQHLESHFLPELIARVTQDRDWSTADIPDYRNPEECWSLESLFPREYTKIHDPYLSDDIRREAVKNAVIEKLVSYPAIVHKLARINHPNQRNSIDIDLWRNNLRMLREKEFYKDISVRNHLKFFPIHSFWQENEATLAQPDLLQLAQQITRKDWRFKEYLSMPVEKSLEWINDWMLQAGFYPGYLEYIFDIAQNNAQRYGQEMEHLTLSETPRDFIISIKTKGRSTAISDSHYDGFRTKIRGLRLNLEFYDRYAEGVEDICKIVCHRYHGRFTFAGRRKSIVCSYQDHHIRMDDVPGIGDELEDFDVAYLLHIPREFARGNNQPI